jgi:hypothetical protein
MGAFKRACEQEIIMAEEVQDLAGGMRRTCLEIAPVAKITVVSEVANASVAKGMHDLRRFVC